MFKTRSIKRRKLSPNVIFGLVFLFFYVFLPPTIDSAFAQTIANNSQSNAEEELDVVENETVEDVSQVDSPEMNQEDSQEGSQEDSPVDVTITSLSSPHGRILPAGVITIPADTDQFFTIKPDSGYHVSNVVVNGVSVGAVNVYQMNHVTSDSTIAVSFEADPLPADIVRTIIATAQPHGSIYPSGTVNVKDKADQNFTIIPEQGYRISEVLVNNSSVGSVNTYLFTDVRSDSTISAKFEADPSVLARSFSLNSPSNINSTNSQSNQNNDDGSNQNNAPTGGTHILTATVGNHGIITPSGEITVNDGGSQTFNIEASAGYHINDVLVNNVSVGPVNVYEFTNIHSDNTISATIGSDSHQYSITVTPARHGSITPDQTSVYNEGATQLFTMTPAANYYLLDVSVDGASLGAVSNYTFSNITSDHTISASFATHVTHTLSASAGVHGSISPSGNVTVDDDENQTFTITPETHFHIVDVLVDGESKGPISSYTFSNVVTNHTIIASFSINTQTITASAGSNGSISPNGSVSVNEGSDQAFTITPANGYHVADVLVNGVSVGAVTNYTFSNIVADATIVANFAINTHTITATAGANGSISPNGSVSVNEGSDQTFTITPTNGYHVADVLVNGVSAGAVTTYTFSNVLADATITASFAIDTYTITATAETNGTITPSGLVLVNHGASQNFNITPLSGYHVSDVLIDDVSVGALTIYNFTDVTANHTIVASFVINPPNTYTITASAGSNGSISPNGSVSVNEGSDQAFTITPANGYHVADVLVNGVSVGAVTNYTFSNIVADATIVANFAINTHTITATAGANGSISPNGSVSVNEGSDQSFSITPASGYHVADVLIDGVSVGALTTYNFTDVTASHTIVASFVINPPNTYTITASAGSNGSVSPNGSISVNEGSDQAFTITPASGYHVADVVVDNHSVGAVGTYAFTNITSDHTIVASFAVDVPNAHLISASAASNGVISPSGSVSVNDGDTQSFTITPDTGYHVLDVLVDGVSVGSVLNYSFNNVTSDHTIVVTFEADAGSHIIRSSTSTNGTISPLGNVNVSDGGSQVFTITPNSGYQIQSVLVDQIPVVLFNNTYTFSNVAENHSISATFVPAANTIHNFTYTYETVGGNKTLLKELNWKSPSGVVKRIVWDESTRGLSPSWMRHFLHSQYNFDGWSYINDQNSRITVPHSNITYAFITPPSSNSNMVEIQSSSNELRVKDTILFIGDTIYITTTVTNLLAQNMTTLEVPTFLGSLMIGNFNTSTRKINVCAYDANHNCIDNNTGTQLSRLRPVNGGFIENNYNHPDHAIWDMYPQIHVTSPVVALWGEDKFEANSDTPISGSVTIGGQFLTKIDLPALGGFLEHAYVNHSPLLKAKYSTNLAAGESQTYVMAFSVADGDAKWQEALLTYKDWFNSQYGVYSPQTQQNEAIPEYCPESPFFYQVGSNRYGRYDQDTHRYTPNSTLSNIYDNSNATLNVMKDLNIKHFGIWQPTIHIDYLSTDPDREEFNPNITLLDPNIDAAINRTKITEFAQSYRDKNMELFWYTTPCRYVEGADINYDAQNPNNSTFITGHFNKEVDLTIQANKDRYMNDLRQFVDRGVKGLYFDAHYCPGDYEFVKSAKEQFGSQVDFFMQEGGIDRSSLMTPVTPMVKWSYEGYVTNGSLLLNYLVPNATFYAGSFNQVLTDTEFDDVLNKGYQPVPNQVAPTRLTSWLCNVIEKGRLNQMSKWQNYGQAKGCPQPPTAMSAACAARTGVNEIYLTVHALTETIGSTDGSIGGSITPSGTMSVLEGSNPSFHIAANSGYYIKEILFVNGPYGWLKQVGAPTTTLDQVFGSIVQQDATMTVRFESALPNPPHTITASAGANGSITPSGAVVVNDGQDQSFTITPATNYHVADVLVDNVSVGAVTTYQFTHVVADHTIAVTFAADIPNSYKITASAGTNGVISPSGDVTVLRGGNQTFTIIPAANYHVLDVLVDNVSVGAVQSYSFSNVVSEHTISASFAVDTQIITASSGDNGNINPTGIVNVGYGSDQVFTFTPDSGYKVQSVLVDQVPVLISDNTYTITNVTTHHDVQVSFVPTASSSNNFTFVFGADTLLKELNWRAPTGVVKRIVWDEQTRFPFNTQYWSPSWIRKYLHSLTASNPDTYHSGFCFKFDDNQACSDEQRFTHAHINYQLVSQNSEQIRINAISDTNEFKVEDEIRFVDDRIYFNITLTNLTTDREMKRVEVPVYFGSLMIGNYDLNTRKIQECGHVFNSDRLCVDESTGPGLGRVRPVTGGLLESRFENPTASVYDLYPSIGTFSPVAALWGDAKYDATNNTPLAGGVTIGAQFLTEVEKPTMIGFVQVPYDQHSPELNAKIVTELQPQESRTFTIVYKIVDGKGGMDSAGSEIWKTALSPYKNWFNFYYGTLNTQNQSYEPTPQYCPTSPFVYVVGANTDPYNPSTHRYEPGSTIKNIYAWDRRSMLQDLGVKRFGLWKLALDARFLDSQGSVDYEFNPNISLIDPNIDAAANRSKLDEFTTDYQANNVDVFVFARVCRYFEGADINYTSGNVTRGVWNDEVDLRIPANRDRYFNDMKSYWDHGVKGFYVDEGERCPGYGDFIKYIMSQYKSQKNGDLFLVQEGVMDRNSLVSPQAPIVKIPVYEENSSLLLNYLVPDATYYGGGFNNPLNDSEFDDVMSKGYQGILGGSTPRQLTSWLCDKMRTSYNNQLEKWNNYGHSIPGCAAPDPVTAACTQHGFDVYKTVTVSVNPSYPNGSVSPSGVLSVLEGSHPELQFNADPGYTIKDILIQGDSYGDHRVSPRCQSTYTLTSPDIVRDTATIVASFYVPATHTVTASAGPNGTISPIGASVVNEGCDKAFTITPNSGYRVASVLVDGVSQGVFTYYTMSNITSDHTISATFVPNP